MPVSTVDDIIRLIKQRDHLSLIEARTIVDDCIEELRRTIHHGNIMECEEIVRDWLGLEPDFLEILLNELM